MMFISSFFIYVAVHSRVRQRHDTIFFVPPLLLSLLSASARPLTVYVMTAAAATTARERVMVSEMHFFFPHLVTDDVERKTEFHNLEDGKVMAAAAGTFIDFGGQYRGIR